MAPAESLFEVVGRSTVASVPVVADALLLRRDLTVNDTQKVTLGVIGAYIVGIAILWNVPYLRQVLWPFKVSPMLVMSWSMESFAMRRRRTSSENDRG